MEFILVGAGSAGRGRGCTVMVGNTYRIEPLDPLKKKNRGRLCRVTGFRADDKNSGLIANVIWLDTKKAGWTRTGDFVEVKPAAPSGGAG